jgi:hypothetical protein
MVREREGRGHRADRVRWKCGVNDAVRWEGEPLALLRSWREGARRGLTSSGSYIERQPFDSGLWGLCVNFSIGRTERLAVYDAAFLLLIFTRQ